jgi:hypothetical protein
MYASSQVAVTTQETSQHWRHAAPTKFDAASVQREAQIVERNQSDLYSTDWGRLEPVRQELLKLALENRGLAPRGELVSLRLPDGPLKSAALSEFVEAANAVLAAIPDQAGVRRSSALKSLAAALDSGALIEAREALRELVDAAGLALRVPTGVDARWQTLLISSQITGNEIGELLNPASRSGPWNRHFTNGSMQQPFAHSPGTLSDFADRCVSFANAIWGTDYYGSGLEQIAAVESLLRLANSAQNLKLALYGGCPELEQTQASAPYVQEFNQALKIALDSGQQGWVIDAVYKDVSKISVLALQGSAAEAQTLAAKVLTRLYVPMLGEGSRQVHSVDEILKAADYDHSQGLVGELGDLAFGIRQAVGVDISTQLEKFVNSAKGVDSAAEKIKLWSETVTNILRDLSDQASLIAGRGGKEDRLFSAPVLGLSFHFSPDRGIDNMSFSGVTSVATEMRQVDVLEAHIAAVQGWTTYADYIERVAKLMGSN